MAENRCVCCGEIIPEGRMVCLRCESAVEQDKPMYVLFARHNGRTYYMELMKKCKELLGLKN